MPGIKKTVNQLLLKMDSMFEKCLVKFSSQIQGNICKQRMQHSKPLPYKSFAVDTLQ